MQNIRRCFSGLLLLLSFSAVVHAEDLITSNIVEISPGIGYYNFDAGRTFADAEMASMGLGLHFSRSWAMLLHYSALNTDIDTNGTSEEGDVLNFHVDVLRFFAIKKRLRPYLVAGIGKLEVISETENYKKNMLNAGAGLYYKLTPNWSLRTDARVFANTNRNYKDNALTVTLGYRFKDGEQGD